jgi:hypothetical protein
MSEVPKMLTNPDNTEVAMPSIEKLAAKNADLRQRVSKLESTVEALTRKLGASDAQLPPAVLAARGMGARTSIEQMNGQRLPRSAVGRHGSPVGPSDDGGIQVLHRGR